MHPLMDTDRAPRACTRVWLGVDSGVPVRKLTQCHMVFCAKSSLTCSRAKFSSRVHLDLEASRMFRPTPRKKIWSNFVPSYFVGEQTLSRGALAAISMILRSGSRDVYTQTMQKAPVHAPCLAWSRFRRSGQEAHTVSYGILRQVEPDL